MSTVSTQSSEGSKNEVVSDNNKDWRVSISRKLNKLYYFNSKTGESLWEKPEGVIFSIQDVEKLLTCLLTKRMSGAKGVAKLTERTVQTPTTYFDYCPSNDQHENSPPEPNLKDDSGQNSGTNFDNKSIINRSKKLEKKEFKGKNLKKDPTIAKLWKASLNIQRKLKSLRNSQVENRIKKLKQMDSVNEVENNETFMDWEDGPQENVEEVKNRMLFEDNLNGRNNSERKNDATSYQFEMNPKQEFNPKLAIVLDTNILISNLKYVKHLKEKPFDEFPARFIVPYIVLEELDHIKKKKGTIKSRGARNAIIMLNVDLFSNHPRIIGQDGKRKSEEEFKTSTSSDDLIIECCLEQMKAGYNVLLFTEDRNMGSRALLNKIESVGVSELKELFPDIIPQSSQIFNSKPHTIVSPRSSFGRLHGEEEENEPVNASDVIPEYSSKHSIFLTETSQNRTGSPIFNSKPHTIVSPRSSFGRLHGEEVENEPVNASDVIPEYSSKHSIVLTETSQNRTVCQSTNSINIPEKSRFNKVKITKKVPENAKLLVCKLKQALESFLTGVLKLYGSCENDSILNICLCYLQANWTNVTNLPLLEEDILTILALKRLLRPVEDITWTVTSVGELMNAAINFADRFQKSDMYNQLTTSFTLILRECQIIERRLKQEIINKKTILPQVVNETESYIAAAALNTTWGHVLTICQNLVSTSNSKETDPQSLSSTNIPLSQNSKDKSKDSNGLKKLNDNEKPFKLNTTKPEPKNLPPPDEDFIDHLSVLYKNVSEMVKGFEGVLNENLRTLTLTHPSIQLLYNTILAMLPDSMPLASPIGNSQTEYLLVDLTPKCIVEYCSQEDSRASLVTAKDSFSDCLITISKYYDDNLSSS